MRIPPEIQFRRLLNAIGMGDIELVRSIIEQGVELDRCDKNHRTPLIRAVGASIVESSVVDALLDAGSDPEHSDIKGLRAVDYARRRLARTGPDVASRSASLDEHGNLKLTPREQRFIERVSRDHPEFADDYLQERRKVATRRFMPRRELEIIVRRLGEVSK